MRNYWLFSIILILIGFWGCSKDEDLAEPGFYKIYDDFDASKKFKVLDISNQGENGFVVLAVVDEIYPAVLKLSPKGDFINGRIEEVAFINPIPRILKVNGENYFLAMNPSTFAAVLVKIDNTGNFSKHLEYNNISYPLAANSIDGKDLLILSYDRALYRSNLNLTNISGETIWFGSTAVNQNVEEQIIRHYNGTGRKYPFFVGKIQSTGFLFANCFNNYNFSLCIFDTENNFPSAIYNGSGYNGGFSSLHQVTSNSFVASRFVFNDNYLIQDFNPSLSGIFFTEDIGGALLSEVAPNSPFYYANVKIMNRDIIVIGTNSINQNVILYFYNTQSKTITHREVIGNAAHPMEIGGLLPTQDNGLAVAITVKIGGIIHRVSLAKLNRKDLVDILN